MRPFLLFLLCSISFAAATAQRTTHKTIQSKNKEFVAEVGPGIGFSIPQIIKRNPDITKPMPGAIIGVEANRLVPFKHNKNLFYSVGIQGYIYYFSSPPSTGEGQTAVGVFGLSVGTPVKFHALLPIAKSTAVWLSAGVVPLIETSGLVRTTQPDGGIRFNAGPDAYAGFLLNNQTGIGIGWMMPLRVYGDPSVHYTYHLHNFTFNVRYCLKGKHFKL
ncbi:hypothetical protein ACTHGU_17105 [Chitinophagaceae bacterium MMS25-I14]